MAKLGGDTLAAAAGAVEQTHQAIARRVFSAIGPSAEPARRTHDAIASLSYRTIARGARIGGEAAAAALQFNGRGARALSARPRGRIAGSLINGWLGDRLDAAASPLAIEMALIRDGVEVELSAAAVAAAYPLAGPRIAIFLHGLVESELIWEPRGGLGEGRFGQRLASEHGLDEVLIRYNSGLHISDNGERFGTLLERLCAAWPVAVEEITIVGHSMGGLLARSALHQSETASEVARWDWPRLTRRIFYLGSPHHGAPLERFANAGARALSAIAETRALGTLIDSRSVGIKDLRFGNLLEGDWRGHDPDELLVDHRPHRDQAVGPDYYFIAATITRSHRHPAARLFGDLLVQTPSAWAAGTHGADEGRYPAGQTRHFGSRNHFALTTDAEVYTQISDWIAAASN